MKRIFATVLSVCILVVILHSFALAEDIPVIVLPEPDSIQDGQIIGDYAESITREVTLYYPSSDGDSLTALTRTISADRENRLIEAVLMELIEAPAGTNSAYAWSSELDLISVELACGTATVNLNAESAVQQSDLNYLMLCRSIANTLLGMDKVEAVNILTMQSSESLRNMPIGVFTSVNDSISAEYALLQAEQNRQLEGSSSFTRSALLYFPSKDGRYLLPEIRTLQFENQNIISSLLNALAEGPAQEDCCFSAIPASLELLRSEPVIRVSESGQRIAELDFSETAANYLAFSGTENWQLYASVVLTLCSFVPEIDGVCLYIGGNPIHDCVSKENPLQFADGVIRREDFSNLIGSCSPRFYADDSGKLIRSCGASSQSGACSAKTILSEMIAYAQPEDETLHSVFPEGVVPGDVLGVRVEGSIASVNLSASFYSRCQSMDADEERCLVYAMVNALCELDSIGSVRFLVEGRSVDSLSRDIYLKSTLMPNPGLVIEKTFED